MTRKRVRVNDLPSGIPNVPVFDGEDAINRAAVAQNFISRFASAVKAEDWTAFGELFVDECWWRDGLTLTFDKRTFRGRSAIVQAWTTLSKDKRPVISYEKRVAYDMEPSYLRVGPTLAHLDVPFNFTLQKPGEQCIGQLKLVPVDGAWKIWILSTGVKYLEDHPFEQLPRKSPSIIDDAQRGKATAQGLPQVEGILDAIVIGGSCNGMANLIMLDAIGANIACFDLESAPGGNWSTKRYKAVRLHHSNFMIQLPMFPVPSEGYQDFLTGDQVTRYYTDAVESLNLPFFGGIRVISNYFDKNTHVWDVCLQDVESGEKGHIKTRNLVLSMGFLVGNDNYNRPKFEGEGRFQGPLEHTAQYRDPGAYRGRNVVVVGSGNSAHDVCKDLALGGAKSVTMLQRSPTVLVDFDVIFPITSGHYKGNQLIDAADFLESALPVAVLRDLSAGLIATLEQAMAARHVLLEEKGYLIDKRPDLLTRVYHERSRSFYIDHLKVFDLVLNDHIRIARGEAVGLDDDGVVVCDTATGARRTLPAEGVVFATGYSDVDLPSRWADTGFLDADSASTLENVNMLGVDEEGESPGYVTDSGHPHLYFSGIGFYMCRWMARYTAIQVMADVTGNFPERYPRNVAS